MARVQTNLTSLRFAVETSIGVLPASPDWRIMEFESLGEFGAQITTVARRPIASDRGRKKGTVTDLDSTVSYDSDLTMDAFSDFAEGFVFAEFANAEFDLKTSTGSLPPPAVGTTDDFTIDAASALLAGKMQFTVAPGVRTLVFAKGYTNAANNGLHELNVDVASTDTTVQVASTLVTETPSTNASLQVAGIRIATADVTLTISGGTATLVSALEVTDWATLGLFAGQFIHFGSAVAGTGAVVNAFDDTGTDDNFGYARITSISGATVNLDKLDVNLTATDTNTGDLDVMFGRFLRNVAVEADADDNRFLERTYQIEGAYPDLGGIGTDEYEYAIGNFANEFSWNLPLADKATASWGFIGTNSDDITPTRKTNAAAAVSPLRVEALNTSSDIASLTTDLISAVSDICFKNLTVTVLNNVSTEKCLGTLGAVFVNSGLFEVNLEGQMLFADKSIVNSIKSNTTLTFLAIIKNTDGAIALDVPSLTFGGGGREFPLDQSVLANITGTAFNDPTGTIPSVSIGISLFPDVPTVRP